jgi:hypothetical protein
VSKQHKGLARSQAALDARKIGESSSGVVVVTPSLTLGEEMVVFVEVVVNVVVGAGRGFIGRVSTSMAVVRERWWRRWRENEMECA